MRKILYTYRNGALVAGVGNGNLSTNIPIGFPITMEGVFSAEAFRNVKIISDKTYALPNTFLPGGG